MNWSQGDQENQLLRRHLKGTRMRHRTIGFELELIVLLEHRTRRPQEIVEVSGPTGRLGQFLSGTSLRVKPLCFTNIRYTFDIAKHSM
jgi:hypothetical protein